MRRNKHAERQGFRLCPRARLPLLRVGELLQDFLKVETQSGLNYTKTE